MTFLAPPGGEPVVPVPARSRLNSPRVALICMHTAFLTEHSTQARKNGKRETKSYFYGKLRSDSGAISQVHLNKSIKAYPNMKGGKKLKLPLPLFLFLPFAFDSQNCGQAFVQVFI